MVMSCICLPQSMCGACDAVCRPQQASQPYRPCSTALTCTYSLKCQFKYMSSICCCEPPTNQSAMSLIIAGSVQICDQQMRGTAHGCCSFWPCPGRTSQGVQSHSMLRKKEQQGTTGPANEGWYSYCWKQGTQRQAWNGVVKHISILQATHVSSK